VEGERGEMRFRAPFFFALCGRVDLEWWVGGMATRKKERKKEFHGHYIIVILQGMSKNSHDRLRLTNELLNDE